MKASRARVFRLSAAILGSVAAAWLVPAAGAAAPAEAFPRVKALRPAAPPTRQIASFDLDEALFAATDRSYANLRILDEEGAETPFLVRCKKEKKTVLSETATPARTVALETLPDNRIEIVVEREETGQTAAAILLHTQQRNYEKQVAVFGSHDRASWKLLTESRPIFDYSRFIDLQNNRVDFEGGSFRYYKVVISNITQTEQSPLTRIARETRDGKLFSQIENGDFLRQDFRVERLELREKKTSEVRTTTVANRYSVLDLKAAALPGEKKTVVTFDTRRVPLTQLTLLASNPNFSRSVIVEATDDAAEKPAWQYIVSATVSRIDAGSFRQANTTVPLAGPRRFLRYRLTINNLDSPPLEISGVEAVGEAHEVLFFGSPGKEYRVFYGAQGLPAPRYDIGAVLANAETADTDVYAPGAEAPNPSFRPRPAAGFQDNRKLLVGAVVLMVLVLSWMIVRTLRRVDAAPGG
jgi:hypothetical protein